ncbi:MAG: hypothetical protein A2Y40_05395 [Candidatus Margulisbacteria bacterium GWF2_35_9]|nr:MAG: hypothetical protein A2Y40_05395 [Candidatus Margulisbacteria bacterium GWF2_35_9]
MKITVITPCFAYSGVPLAQTRFARALAKRAHDVELIIGFVDKKYTLPTIQGVSVSVWNKSRVLSMLFPLIKYLKTSKPDVVFSAEDHLNSIVLLALILSGSKAKFSGSSRVTPYDTYINKNFPKGWILKQLMKAIMWRANVLTCVSKDMVLQYQKIFKNPHHLAVYNIVDDVASREKMTEPVKHPWLIKKELPVIIAAGQIEPWKDFATLISAIKYLHKKSLVRLIILGEGSLRNELQELAKNFGIGDFVCFEGQVKNPLKYFVYSDIFVLSSLVEGLPNVLVEAMMCGCTPVATDCPTGPREVLEDGKYGYLVPMGDPETMAKAILQAIDKPIPAKILAEKVKEFEENTIIDRHFDLLGIK